jgi:hypothetical protein
MSSYGVLSDERPDLSFVDSDRFLVLGIGHLNEVQVQRKATPLIGDSQRSRY